MTGHARGTGPAGAGCTVSATHRWRGLTWSAQDRNASYLMLNTIVGAAGGFAFWLVATRWASISTAQVGTGYALIALATLVAVVGKGGLDTALMRHVPGAGRTGAARLLCVAIGAGVTVGLVLTTLLAAGSAVGLALPALDVATGAFVAVIATLLIVTWLQDAYYLGLGTARPTLLRNVIVGVARFAVVVPLVLLALPEPIAFAWALALLISALAAATMGRAIARAAGAKVSWPVFFRSAAANTTGGAAELVPGLVLAPLVFALAGATQAAYFGIAWAAASILFIASMGLGRGVMVELMRADAPGQARALRRGLAQQALILGPAAIVAIALAHSLLSLFGASYANAGAPAFIILCASILFVAPTSVYLALLRARDASLELVLLPLSLVVMLFVLSPPLLMRWGLAGVAMAWLLSSAPLGLFSAWNLRTRHRGLMQLG